MTEHANLKFSVVTYGEKGSICFERVGEGAAAPVREHKEAAWIPTGKKVVDTTGAGDAFNAGVVLGYAEGRWQMAQILEFAAMIAGYNVCELGPRKGLPSTQIQLKDFLGLKETLNV